VNELRFGTESTILGIKVLEWTMFSNFKVEIVGLDMQRVCAEW